MYNPVTIEKTFRKLLSFLEERFAVILNPRLSIKDNLDQPVILESDTILIDSDFPRFKETPTPYRYLQTLLLGALGSIIEASESPSCLNLRFYFKRYFREYADEYPHPLGLYSKHHFVQKFVFTCLEYLYHENSLPRTNLTDFLFLFQTFYYPSLKIKESCLDHQSHHDSSFISFTLDDDSITLEINPLIPLWTLTFRREDSTLTLSRPISDSLSIFDLTFHVKQGLSCI